MRACPRRENFYQKLGDNRERVLAQFEKWLAALERIVVILVELYK